MQFLHTDTSNRILTLLREFPKVRNFSRLLKKSFWMGEFHLLMEY